MTRDEMEVWYEYQYSQGFYEWKRLLSEEGKKEFENFCAEKGKKNSRKKFALAAGIGVVSVVAALVGGYALLGKKQIPQREVAENESAKNEIADEAENKVEEQPESILSLQTVDELKKQMKSEKSKDDFQNAEFFYLTDEEGNFINLSELLNDDSDLDNVSENSVLIDENGETKKTRTRGASTRERRKRGASKRGSQANSTIEDTLQNAKDLKDTQIAIQNFDETKTKFICNFYFSYGSSLNISKSVFAVEESLLLQKTEDRKEFNSCVLALNEMLSTIPEDKRNDAEFFLMGYADPTLFNGKIEISERSKKFNEELSKKRAESIKSIMVGKELKISPEKIKTFGYGYSKNEHETSNLSQYRRVDVLVTFD